jgi:hypothetical protein
MNKNNLLKVKCNVKYESKDNFNTVSSSLVKEKALRLPRQQKDFKILPKS